jgi:8-oxo-dGTP pyrophosphatase MutT (NUDIX family)/phosphohistidine phosphatase SixA
VSGGTIRAAGGVLWRSYPSETGDENVEVAVIHRPRYMDWSLPKGKIASRESEIDGAIREVLEETGYHVRLGRPLGETRYMKEQDGLVRPKVVRWWAMEAAGGSFSPNHEVDELRWVSLDEAAEMLTREHDRALLNRFVHGPAPTRTVLLVRHGSAESRRGWEGDDRNRPLDECGWEQADELVRLLSHFDPTRLLSADYVRCRQTVRPLAESLGLRLEDEPLVSEAGYPGHEESAVQLVRSIGRPHDATVICSQGAVIPDLLARLATGDDVDLPLPAASEKGGTWALTFQGERLANAEYFAAPQPDACAGRSGARDQASAVAARG